jgi:two-component system, LytTR family, sensor kinase
VSAAVQPAFELDPRVSQRRRYLKIAAFVFLAWTLIGVMNTFQRLANTADMRSEYPVWILAKIAIITHWMKAALSVPLIWLVERFPLGRETWKRRSAIYFAVLIAYITVFVVARPYLVPTIYFEPSSGHVLATRPPFWDQFIVALRSFFGDLFYSYCLTIVAAHWWQYALKVKRTQIEQERLQARLASSELQALKMQLQPHFLFNTLHTISNLTSLDTTKAQRMIARLSELLRLSLEHVSSDAIPLRRELDFLESYLEIEKTRFEERLKVTISCDEEILDAAVPNMLLQPLVENAIKHGVSKKAAGGSIMIVARRELDRVMIAISDDGAGVSANGGGYGIGIANTRARLQQLYGGDFAFEVRPTERGMVVRIELPYQVHPSCEMEEVSA